MSIQCYFVHYVHKISEKLSTASIVSIVSTGIAPQLHLKSGRATQILYIIFLLNLKVSTYEWYKNWGLDSYSVHTVLKAMRKLATVPIVSTEIAHELHTKTGKATCLIVINKNSKILINTKKVYLPSKSLPSRHD